MKKYEKIEDDDFDQFDERRFYWDEIVVPSILSIAFVVLVLFGIGYL